jgi:hypothetical protein
MSPGSIAGYRGQQGFGIKRRSVHEKQRTLQVTSHFCLPPPRVFCDFFFLQGHAACTCPVFPESGLKEANWGLRASFTLVRALFTWASPQPWRHAWRCFSHVLITSYPKIAGRVTLSPQDSKASCKVHAVETDPELKAWGDFATCLHSRPPTSYWTIATSRSVLRANEV